MLFRVLGPVEVHGRDGEVHRLGVGKPATVLATLLVHPNAWVSTSTLIDATWHEAAPPGSARANLKTYIWQLRRLLPSPDDGLPRIESVPGRYRLRVAPGELDTDHVAHHAARARAAAQAGDVATAIDAVTAALRLWRGRPFEGLPDALDDATDRLTQLYHRLRDDLADAQLALGRTRDAVRTLRAITADDPLREGAWARLMRALHALGRYAEAACAYERARRILAAELGVPPGRELTAARREVDRPATGPVRELPRHPARVVGPVPIRLAEADGAAAGRHGGEAARPVRARSGSSPDGRCRCRRVRPACPAPGSPAPAADVVRVRR
ncbi:BTAD domain-containing putative transcriptional regulator [Prauserella oleivorans]|uniref:BTAD domain-containing putative transcriptional regulator n=1 Tax=Prauserella oleivorans TaxID=1478153 RepID=A0ABW5W973_9PSEU